MMMLEWAALLVMYVAMLDCFTAAVVQSNCAAFPEIHGQGQCIQRAAELCRSGI